MLKEYTSNKQSSDTVKFSRSLRTIRELSLELTQDPFTYLRKLDLIIVVCYFQASTRMEISLALFKLFRNSNNIGFLLFLT